MDDLRKTYSELRAQYKGTLSQALKEADPDKRKELVLQLIDLNQKMNEVVASMMNVTAQMESRVSLDDLNTHLSDELVRIQQEAQSLHSSRGEVEVLRRLASQQKEQTEGDKVTLYLYLGALVLGLFLIVLSVLNSSFLTPAMPPVSTPQLGSPGYLLGE